MLYILNFLNKTKRERKKFQKKIQSRRRRNARKKGKSYITLKKNLLTIQHILKKI